MTTVIDAIDTTTARAHELLPRICNAVQLLGTASYTTVKAIVPLCASRQIRTNGAGQGFLVNSAFCVQFGFGLRTATILFMMKSRSDHIQGDHRCRGNKRHVHADS